MARFCNVSGSAYSLVYSTFYMLFSYVFLHYVMMCVTIVTYTSRKAGDTLAKWTSTELTHRIGCVSTVSPTIPIFKMECR